MKTDVQKSGDEFGSGNPARELQEVRTCPTCHAPLPLGGADEFCPVCMLRRAVSDEFDGEEFAGSSADPDSSKDRFEHYELAKDEDGMPIELGRGAMGVTYKAFDINLRCPVTLKVISERYLGGRAFVCAPQPNPRRPA